VQRISNIYCDFREEEKITDASKKKDEVSHTWQLRLWGFGLGVSYKS